MINTPNSPLVLRAKSVSSTLNTNPPSLPSPKSNWPFLATSQLYNAVLAPPTWSEPVGEGANLIRGGRSNTFLPAFGNNALCSSSAEVEIVSVWSSTDDFNASIAPSKYPGMEAHFSLREALLGRARRRRMPEASTASLLFVEKDKLWWDEAVLMRARRRVGVRVKAWKSWFQDWFVSELLCKIDVGEQNSGTYKMERINTLLVLRNKTMVKIYAFLTIIRITSNSQLHNRISMDQKSSRHKHRTAQQIISELHSLLMKLLLRSIKLELIGCSIWFLYI